jgi:hypothetical protein
MKYIHKVRDDNMQVNAMLTLPEHLSSPPGTDNTMAKRKKTKGQTTIH